MLNRILFNYTCDKQVLWESAGAFFSARQLSDFTRQLARFTRSWSSGKMFAFQPRGFVFEPVGVRHFFYKYSEAEGADFFRHYETFRLCETFFRNFLNVPKESSFQYFFLIFCKRTNVKKSQRVPFFRIFGTIRLFKILIFFENFLDSLIFFKNFLMSPKRPPFNFLISCNRTNVIKS